MDHPASGPARRAARPSRNARGQRAARSRGRAARGEPDALRIRGVQHEALADLARRALNGADPSTLMDHAVACVGRILEVQYCEILELTPDRGHCRVCARAGRDTRPPERALVGARAGSHAAFTLEASGPVIVDDIAAETRFRTPDLVRERRIVSAVSVAITDGEQPYGLLGAYTTKRRRFSRDEGHFLQAVADILAMAVKHARAERDRAALHAAEQRARTEAESLADVGRLINHSLELREVAQRIAESVLTLVGADSATVLGLDADSGDLKILSIAGRGVEGHAGALAFRRGSGLSGLAVELRSPAVSADILADPRLAYGKATRERLARAGIEAAVAIPLIAHDTIIGVLAAGRRTPFTDEHVRLARAFGEHAAVAIWNARLHEQLRTRLTQSETLLAVSEQVTAVVDVTETMRRVSRQIGLALGADMVGAFLADADEQHLRPIAGWHVPRVFLREFLTYPIPLKGHQILEDAWRRCAPVWLNNVGADPRVNREAFERFPHRSNVFCPMVVQGKPIGALFVTWWDAERALTTEELQLVQGISRQAGIALANARLVDDLRSRQQRLEALLDGSRALSRIQTPATLLSGIARACGDLLGSDSVGVRLLDGDELVLAGVWGDPIVKPGLRIDESLSGRVATSGEPLVVGDLDSDPRRIPEHRAAVHALGYRAWLGVPVKLGDRVTGVLSMQTKRPGGFSEEDVALAGALAAQAAVALDNGRLYQEVEEARRRLELLSRRLVETQEADRRLIARELHEEIAQLLAGLKLALEADRAPCPVPSDVRNQTAYRLVLGLIERVRGLSLDLRPAMLDDLGLAPALLSHFDRYRADTNIRVRFEQRLPHGTRFPSSVETAAYRIVQEALTNVARHAAVRDATVRLWTAGARLYVQVLDDGVGFDPKIAGDARSSSGLVGMRERAALLGGELTIDAAPAVGVRVTAQFDLDHF